MTDHDVKELHEKTVNLETLWRWKKKMFYFTEKSRALPNQLQDRLFSILMS